VPREVTVLQVIVSSPADLREERELLQEIVEELNATWRTSSRIQLNLLMWEKDTRPALAADAQTAINSQLGDDYDIFIGMMAARFGTPTERAESGTEEEFERAKARFEKDPNSVSVMFYFKDAAPASLSEIDPKQLGRVQEFKRKVESIGLVRVFKSRDEFGRMMRMHLSQEVQNWSKRLRAGSIERELVNVESTVEQNNKSASASDEEGYLDLIERGEEEFESLTRIIERITAAVREVGEKTDERRAEIDELNARAQATNTPSDLKSIKRVTNQIAGYLDEFVARLDAEIPIFAASLKKAIDPFMTAINMSDMKAPSREELATAISSATQMIVSQEQAIVSYRSMRDTLAHVPRATTALNQSKRRAVDSVTRLLDEFEKSLRLMREFHDFLRTFQQNGPPTVA